MKNKQINFNINSESYVRTEFKNFCNQYDLDFSEIRSIVTSTASKDKNFSNEDFSSIQNLDQLFDFCMVNFGLGSFITKGFKTVKNLFKSKPKKVPKPQLVKGQKPKFEGKTKAQRAAAASPEAKKAMDAQRAANKRIAESKGQHLSKTMTAEQKQQARLQRKLDQKKAVQNKPQTQTLQEHGGTVPQNPATNKAPTTPTGQQSGAPINDMKQAKQQSFDTQKSVRQQNAIAKENRFNELEKERVGKGFFRQIGTDVKQLMNSPGKYINRHFVRAGLGATSLAGAGVVGAGAIHAAGNRNE